MNNVFERIKLNNITLKNRIVRSATHDYLGNTDGTVTDDEYRLYDELASHNIGLIITAHACVSKLGKASIDQNCFYDDSFVDGMKGIVEAVKKHDSKIVLQISHSGGKAKPSYTDGQTPIAPSSVEIIPKNVLPREMTTDDMAAVRDQFVEAALRAQRAGFDGVQIHCAHGYLLSQFISPVFNKRTDDYGGPIENRFRLAAEVISAVRAATGDSFPVFVKVNSNIEENDDAFGCDFLYIMNEFKKLGVEAAEVSGCNFTAMPPAGGPYYLKRASEARNAADVPVILVGGIRSLDDMDKVLGTGIDMVSLSRPFICEPDLVDRLRSGQAKARCISCSKCFSLYKKEGKRCVFQH